MWELALQVVSIGPSEHCPSAALPSVPVQIVPSPGMVVSSTHAFGFVGSPAAFEQVPAATAAQSES